MAKMDDETRELLRRKAEEKKHRNTLRSLDKTLGLIALDHVQERHADGLPKALVDHYGTLYVARERDAAVTCVELRNVNDSTWLDEARVAYTFHKATDRKRYDRTCRWTRLRFAQPWMVDELVARFPSRRVWHVPYKGPDSGSDPETIAVHPLDVVIAWFRFLWPEDREWGARAQKYLHAYTDNYVTWCPGVGQKVRITELGSVDDRELTLPLDAVISDVAQTSGRIRPLIRHPDEGQFVIGLYREHGDRWDVID
jgi:hypothetical protein